MKLLTLIWLIIVTFLAVFTLCYNANGSIKTHILIFILLWCPNIAQAAKNYYDAADPIFQ